MHLRRAKNDALDAVMIAACTAALDQAREAPDARLAELAEQLTFLEQIEKTSSATRPGSNIPPSHGFDA